MPARKAVTRTQVYSDLWALASAPALVRVRSRVLVHDRNTTGAPCPCCGSTEAIVVEEREDLDLLIDTVGGRRWLRRAAPDTAKYDEIAGQADRTVELPLRCSTTTVDALLDETTPITLASGASRSGKTTLMCSWSVRQWLLRGHSRARAAMIAPTRALAKILLNKFVRGEHGLAPILPAELILSYSRTASGEPSCTVPDPELVLLDGTVIEVRHGGGDGGQLAGKAFSWWIWTEASLTRDPEVYVQLRGRLVSTGGQGFLDAVPRASSWIRSSIVEPSVEDEQRAKESASNGGDYRRRFRVLGLSTADNPWADQRLAAEFRADVELVDERLAARNAGGEWIGNANKSFEFDMAKHSFSYEGWDTDYLGLQDITRHASLRWFYEEHDWLVSVDVNSNPHSAIIGKIAIPRGASPLDLAAWKLVIFDTLRVRDADSEQAAKKLSEIHGKRFAKAGVVIDASATYRGHNSGGSLNSAKGILPAQAYEDLGFEVRGPDRWKTKHRNYRNPERYSSTIIVRRLLRENKFLVGRDRAKALVSALREQEADRDGVSPKRASHNSRAEQEVNGLTDCLRYLAFPFFNVENWERDTSSDPNATNVVHLAR